MRKRFSILLSLFILLVMLASCANPQTSTTTLRHIRLPMGYIPNVQYAPFYVAVEKGYFRQAGVEIEFDYSTETDGIALVGAGELPFTVASAEQVLLARAQGLPVVYVLDWWQDYPVAVVSMKASNIRKPQDLAGKKVGLPGTFGASYIGLQALLHAGGLQERDITLDSIGFTQVEALVTGQEDAVVVYTNNEPIQLQARGYEINVIRVADYVKLASNGLVTNESTLQNDPDLVRGMVLALIQGISDSLANPDEAYQISKKYVEGLEGDQTGIPRQILEASLPFWQAQTLGYSQPAAWQNMQKVLLDMGSLKAPLDLQAAYTNQFIPGQ